LLYLFTLFSEYLYIPDVAY